MEEETNIKKSEIIILAVLVLLIVAARSFYIDLPLQSSEKIHAGIAMNMDKGKLPYKDAYDTQPPFIYHIYAAAFKYIGKTYHAIRLFTLAYIIFTVIVLYILIRLVSGKMEAMIAVVFYGLFIHNISIGGIYSSPELFTHLPLLLGIMFLSDDDAKYQRVNYMLTGLFFGTALFVDASIGFILFVPVVVIMLTKTDRQMQLSLFYRYTSGVFIVIFGFLLWYQNNGITAYFWEYNIIDSMKEIGKSDLRVFDGNLFKFLKSGILPLIGVVAALIAVIKDPAKWVLIPLMSFVAIISGIILERQITSHVFMALAPFSAILAAWAFRELNDIIGKRNAKGAPYITVLAAVPFVFFYLIFSGILNL